jgi:hypothetical protein
MGLPVSMETTNQARDPEGKDENNLGSNWTIHTSEPIPMRKLNFKFFSQFIDAKVLYYYTEIFLKIEAN